MSGLRLCFRRKAGKRIREMSKLRYRLAHVRLEAWRSVMIETPQNRPAKAWDTRAVQDLRTPSERQDRGLHERV